MKTTKKCDCDWCKNWSPKLDKISKALPSKERKYFNDFVDYYLNLELDENVAQAKLEGSWPNWEWLPAEIKKHNLT